MGRRRSSPTPYLGNHPCHFGCGSVLRSKTEFPAKDWDWFTGYGERPVHFCPSCRRTRQAEIDRIREHLNIRPSDYPRVRQSLPSGPNGGDSRG